MRFKYDISDMRCRLVFMSSSNSFFSPQQFLALLQQMSVVHLYPK